MNKTFTLLGGLIGGFSLLKAPYEGTFLASLNTFFDIVGVLSVAAFSVALIYYGVRDFFQK
jgi:hypothetical protein